MRMYLITRLPTNLRSTSRACVHLVRRGHFRLRNKDDGKSKVSV